MYVRIHTSYMICVCKLRIRMSLAEGSCTDGSTLVETYISINMPERKGGGLVSLKTIPLNHAE